MCVVGCFIQLAVMCLYVEEAVRVWKGISDSNNDNTIPHLSNAMMEERYKMLMRMSDGWW